MNIRILLLLGLVSTAPAWAEMYKWTDEQGVVHYSDQPAASGAKSEKKLDIPNQPAPPAAAPAKNWQEKNLEFKKRQNATAEAEAKQQKDAQDAKTKADNCAKAKSSLQTYESGQRVFTYDPQGNRSYLDEAQHEKALADARKSVAEWCK